MLDVTKEEPEVTMDADSEAIRSTERANSKPYLKFGVSAILGLDVHRHQDSDGSLRLPEESAKLDIKAELFQHAGDEPSTKSFHPAYLHSYFHPLIQQAHSQATKHFSGKMELFFISIF